MNQQIGHINRAIQCYLTSKVEFNELPFKFINFPQLSDLVLQFHNFYSKFQILCFPSFTAMFKFKHSPVNFVSNMYGSLCISGFYNRKRDSKAPPCLDVISFNPQALTQLCCSTLNSALSRANYEEFGVDLKTTDCREHCSESTLLLLKNSDRIQPNMDKATVLKYLREVCKIYKQASQNSKLYLYTFI